MTRPDFAQFLVVGAGAAGLMAGRELARAGRRVTILEARDRCGGRIYPLPASEFGYPAEGGAEFVHGAAPVTRSVLRAAKLALQPRAGSRWRARNGTLAPDGAPLAHAARFHRVLAEIDGDLPVAEFLERHFAGRQYDELRRAVTRMVEGYDAADPRRASTLAIRDEWLARDEGEHGRIADGYGALIDYLSAECRRHGAEIHLGAAVAAIAETRGRLVAHCRNGAICEADAAILTIPPPLLPAIALPAAARARTARMAEIGYGNVVKILLRFRTKWWAGHRGRDLGALSFLLSEAAVPTWWTQYPAEHPVLTGWLAGPRSDRVASLNPGELVDLGLRSLAEIFALPKDMLGSDLVAAQAVNWGNDPFALGAYSYATPETRAVQRVLGQTEGHILFAGEALYAGPDMGTVEAALASGRDAALRALGSASGGAGGNCC